MAYVTWASGSSAERASLDDTKVATGFIEEAATYQNMNWILNRVDTRISALENPAEYAEQYTPAASRTGTIASGVNFTVPSYIVGSGHLQVFLDGIPCVAGAGAQYVEVGTSGSASTTIQWNQDIPATYSILARAPKNGTINATSPSYEKAYTADGSVNAVTVTLDPSIHDCCYVVTGKGSVTITVSPMATGLVRFGMLRVKTPATDSISSLTFSGTTFTSAAPTTLAANSEADIMLIYAGGSVFAVPLVPYVAA